MLCPDEDDEIMAELRRTREKLAEIYGDDLRLLREENMRHQEKFPHKYVSFNKTDPNCVPDTWRYEDFFARSRPKVDPETAEPPDGKE